MWRSMFNLIKPGADIVWCISFASTAPRNLRPVKTQIIKLYAVIEKRLMWRWDRVRRALVSKRRVRDFSYIPLDKLASYFFDVEPDRRQRAKRFVTFRALYECYNYQKTALHCVVKM